MEDLTGKIIGGYEMRELVGAGGMGMVYRAYQRSVGREVAVKLILPQYANQPEFIRKFEAEAQMVARLEHPYIVPLYDFWREPSGAYLVMRWLRGGSLRTVLEHGPLSVDAITRLFDQLTSALQDAHAAGIVHRDLKPDNVLRDEAGNIYLSDFGIAKMMGRETISESISGSFLYIAPEQLMGNLPQPQADLYSLGIMLYELLTGRNPLSGLSPTEIMLRHINTPLPPLPDGHDFPEALNYVIQRATAKTPEERYANARALYQALHDAVTPLATVLPIERQPAQVNPYKGLRAFTEADTSDFFGREVLVDGLIELLTPTTDTSTTPIRETGKEREAALHRFLAVVGPSGSGKSSAVFAGLLPILRRGALPDSDRWFIVTMTPGDNPLAALEAALLSVAAKPASYLKEQLRGSERGLLWAVDALLPDNEAEVLLVVDQLEELFTLVTEEATRDHFLKLLAASATDSASRVRVIVTLRADYLDRALIYPEFGAVLRQRVEFVLPLSPAEIERAIAQPAQRVGVTVDADLVAAVVADVRAEPGTLPLLQYALTETFDASDRRRLTLADYAGHGGVIGALAKRAETVYGALDTSQQSAVRQLFLRLTSLGEGTGDARRRVRRSELAALTANPDPLLEAFGRYRLLTFDHEAGTREPTVEVAHEALLRSWPQLRHWLDTSRDAIRQQRMLADAAAEWERSGREKSYLLAGTRLAGFAEWAKTTDIALTAAERAYLDASIAERQRADELETARKLHETRLERRAQNFLRVLVGVFLAATLIAGMLALLAFDQSRTAQNNAGTATIAQGQALAEAARVETAAADIHGLALTNGAQLALSAGNTDLAIALALESGKLPRTEGLRALADAAFAPGTRRRFDFGQDMIWDAVYSPDGQTALFGASDHDMILWDIARGEEIRRYSGHDDWVRSVAFSSDARFALSGSADSTVILWNIETGEIVHRMRGHSASVDAVAFSPDGTQALSGAQDNLAILWNLETGEAIMRLEGHSEWVSSIAFGPGGLTALTGSFDKTVILWNLRSGEPIIRFSGHTEAVGDVKFSPDGLYALSGSTDKSLIFWSFETGAALRHYKGHSGAVTSVAFSPDGAYILSGATDNAMILWDANTTAALHTFRGHTASITNVVLSPDGRSALSSAYDNSVRQWDLFNGAEIQRYQGHDEYVSAITISPDGQRMASASGDDSIVVWDSASGEMLHRLVGHEGDVFGVAFSSDGTLLASSGDDDQVILWDSVTGEMLKTLAGHRDGVTDVAFSPDGRLLLSASQDNTLILWDSDPDSSTFGEQLQRWIGHTWIVNDVTFSPDGETALSSSWDNTLILWDVETGTKIRQYEGHSDMVWGAVFSPDGETILSGSVDRTMILWNTRTGAIMRRFVGHSAQVNAVAFTPDGQYALSSSRDNTVAVWNIASGAELYRLTGHTDTVSDVMLWQDQGAGLEAFSASADGTVRRWQVFTAFDALATWVKTNRHRYTLTCEEHALYNVPPLCTAPTATPDPNLQQT